MKRLVSLLVLVCLFAFPALGQQPWSPFGNYSQTTSYFTTVQQPINADGSSVFAAKKGVIPVKFSLATGNGDLIIASTADPYPDPRSYGGVIFTLPTGLTLNNMVSLIFNGTIQGCGAGSPRFTLDYGNNQVMYIYLGGEITSNIPNGGCENGSGVNLLSSTTAARFEATSLGNTVQYDTLPNILSLYGDMPIQGMWFVTDNGSSQITLHSVLIGSSTFTFASAATPTCTLPPATIDLTTVAGVSLLGVDETTYTMQADSGYNFRIAGCQYMYNLNAKPLNTGTYKVFVNVGSGGDVQTTPGSFTMK